MKVGDLVAATLHTEDVHVGIISKCKHTKDILDVADALDIMFPYFICFADSGLNDWFGPEILKVLNESR